MGGLSRAGAAVRRIAARLVPAARRDWAEALWAEAAQVPPGLRRLAWRAGGVQLIAREALMRRSLRGAAPFAAAAALSSWAAWPDSPVSFANSVDQIDAITIVVVLGGLALVTRRVFGPRGSSQVARILRVSTYAAILALIPAKNVVEQVLDVPPRGGIDLRLYRLISGSGFGDHWKNEILFLIVMALYAAAILWMTSERSRVAAATLEAGTGAGIAVGAAWYVVGPLGFGGSFGTNPWLPGSDLVPFIMLAVLSLACAPAVAAAVAYRRCTASGNSAPSTADRARQILAAGILTSLVSALFVTVAGTGTTAAMLASPSVRNWLYHGHQLSGVALLRLVFQGDPAALAYSHQITAATDAPPFLIICIVFPLIALVLTGLGVLGVLGGAAAAGNGPGPDDGGPPGPDAVPDPAGGAHWPTGPDDDARLGNGPMPPAESLRALGSTGKKRHATCSSCAGPGNQG